MKKLINTIITYWYCAELILLQLAKKFKKYTTSI